MTDNERRPPIIEQPTREPPERVELINRITDAISALETRMDAFEERQLREDKAFGRSPQSLN
jgi:hypothetical protein